LCGFKKRYTYYMGELGNKLTKLAKLTRPHRIILSRDSLGNMHLNYLLADFTCNRNTPYCPYTRQDLPSQVLQPQQLGVGVSGGAEAAVHGARRLVSNLPAGHVVVKLDFCNAFNCVRRDLILDSIATNIPEIYRLVYSVFSCEPVLTFGSHEILSSEGAHQGDPLGSLEFCEAIHPLLL